jgi:predicted  nucleic acid-binding Zn-ribbon protein
MTTALHDLEGRLAAIKLHIAHLREQRDRAALFSDGDDRALEKLERDLRDAELDGLRLEAAIQNLESADQGPADQAAAWA